MRHARFHAAGPPVTLACPRSLAPFGALVRAGPPDEHLMDARIFRSIQNAAMPPAWVKLGEPALHPGVARRWRPGAPPPPMSHNPWERTIIVPTQRRDHALMVAAGPCDPPRLFRLAAGHAVNLKAGIRHSALFCLEVDTAPYWIVAPA